MVFDLERHRASFKNLGVDDIKLHYTVTGHPAVAVNPKGAANLSCPTPQQWGSQEVIMIEPTRQQYTVFMARVSDTCQDAPLGHDHGRQQVSNLPVLFPKKISDVIHHILTADVLSVSSFCTWWKQTRQSNDFWIEAPKAFYRIHFVPRRAFFYPDKWRTPYVAQRDCLLAELGSVRSTWAVACMNYRGLEPAHDMWQHGAPLSHDVLWIGRSVFARRPSHLSRPLDGIRLQEHMGHEQGRVDCGSLRSGAGVPLVLDNGGDSVSTTGASTCFEESFESDPWPEAQVLEGLAKEARRNKDYHEETIVKVIKGLARFGEGDRHRQAVPTGGHIVVLGAYSYGAFHGVNQRTMKFPQCALYLNAWAKAQGFRGPWTSISVAVNVGHLLHRDPNNLPGSANQTTAVGNFSGGRLWLEKCHEDGAANHYEDHDGEDHEILTKEGKKMDGAYVSTKGRVHAFNPKRRHFVEDWRGERISLSTYTIRGVDQLNGHEEDFLRSLGFPRHGNPLRVLARANPQSRGPEQAQEERPEADLEMRSPGKCAAGHDHRGEFQLRRRGGSGA